jgi:threonyl-tRNA synthetase
VSEKFIEYCNELNQQLKEAGIRTVVDGSDNKLGYKIRNSVSKKIPYSLVVGEKEIESKNFNLRSRKGENTSFAAIEELKEHFQNN